MNYRPVLIAYFISLLVSCYSLSIFAGDSLYGTVVEVKSADTIVLDYGDGQYELKLAGIDVPRDRALAIQADQFVRELVLDKPARMRFQGRSEGGEMWVRLYTDDPEIGIKEVNVELVRAGLARRQKDFDFPYLELSTAEREAQEAQRGLWTATR